MPRTEKYVEQVEKSFLRPGVRLSNVVELTAISYGSQPRLFAAKCGASEFSAASVAPAATAAQTRTTSASAVPFPSCRWMRWHLRLCVRSCPLSSAAISLSTPVSRSPPLLPCLALYPPLVSCASLCCCSAVLLGCATSHSMGAHPLSASPRALGPVYWRGEPRLQLGLSCVLGPRVEGGCRDVTS